VRVARDPSPGELLRRFLQVNRIELAEVSRYALLQLCSAPLYLSAREVPVAVVHRLEFTAIDGNARLRQQPHLSAKLNEARAYLADRGPVVLAEIGNGFVIGNKPPQQPHHLEIATRLALEPSARLHAIEIPVDVEFQKGRRVIGRSSRGCRLNPIEAQFSQIDSSHEGVDHANRIALSVHCPRSASATKRFIDPPAESSVES
jgi:hypothetical protein